MVLLEVDRCTIGRIVESRRNVAHNSPLLFPLLSREEAERRGEEINLYLSNRLPPFFLLPLPLPHANGTFQYIDRDMYRQQLQLSFHPSFHLFTRKTLRFTQEISGLL